MNLENYPFISVICNKKININMYVVINLVSKQYISYYNLSKIYKNDLNEFYSLVINWWKNNSGLPISLYYQNKMDDFEYALEFLENKNYEIISGNVGTNLKNLSEKRIKRKVIDLTQ